MEYIDTLLDTRLLFVTVVTVDTTVVVFVACSEFSITVELKAGSSSYVTSPIPIDGSLSDAISHGAPKVRRKSNLTKRSIS